MTVNEFIEKVASFIVKDCNSKNLLPSPTLAQSIIESAYGNSSLATQGNALFGIKADSRWSGKVITKDTKECYDGINLVPTVACFRAYNSWDESIIDHSNFLLQNKRYSNLVGVRDYKTYCQLIKEDGYATSPTYAQTLINCIERYNLAKYDTLEVEEDKTDAYEVIKPKLRFNVHAGHNPSSMVASGSVGYLNESDENRVICNLVIEKLRALGHAAYDCTCNNGKSQKDVLQKIVAKSSQNDVDYDVSIHFNAISKEAVSDGKNKGTEVWIYPNSKAYDVARSVCDSIANLGFTNRGVKTSDTLYFLKNTKAPALLIECCFADDVDDFALYKPEEMANAIVKGLTGEVVTEIPKEEVATEELYYVIVGTYKSKENAEKFAKHLAEDGYLMNEQGNLIRGIVTNIKKGISN